ncbi:MAG TPA: ATP-binding protein [Lapillicoccus sp.]|jgi:signal transduction histidine kinase|uniref:ATP-binding protein n=1 Tax=Lapillicoccus sp. TaxID=1909287 RepID=UPI002F932B08
MLTRFQQIGLRGRLMTIGVLGVAGALVLGGVILYAVLASSLTRTVQSTALASAQEVALLVSSGRIPDPVPASGAQVVQVLSADNRVLTGSLTADRLTALVTPEEKERAVAGDVVVVAGNRSGLSGGLQVSAVEAGSGADRVTVVAALPTADLESATTTLRNLLLVVFPLLLLVCALIAWRVIGAALKPVEELRSGAASIDGSSTDERLPVPPTHDEIAALATTLNEMLDRVAGARRTQRAFVADAAHELRSPLATMRTQLEVATRLGEGGRLPDDLLPEVARLSGLVEDLLLLARADDGGTPTPSVTGAVELGGLVDEVSARYATARVPVRSGVASGLVPVSVDASYDDLYRALTNLVDNAVRHASSEVELSLDVVDGTARIGVTDDGHGIPEADRERVFDRFTRLDEARDRDSGGTGLGLAIARELLRRNGSRVFLEDARPGVRAVVTLPTGQDLSRS